MIYLVGAGNLNIVYFVIIIQFIYYISILAKILYLLVGYLEITLYIRGVKNIFNFLHKKKTTYLSFSTRVQLV